MKKLKLILCILGFAIPGLQRSHAQANEIAQLILNFEKLQQFKSILQQMKDGYEILSGGYNTVVNIAKGNFKIHKDFLDGLLKVSPAVRKYKRVADIMEYQKVIVKEYKQAIAGFTGSGNFTRDELTYIGHVYAGLFKESLRNLDELTDILTEGKMRMSDEERLKGIDSIYENMEDKLLFLRHFNSNATLLAIQRAKETNDVNALRHIYHINN